MGVGRLGDDWRAWPISGHDFYGGECGEDESAGGDGGSSGVEAIDLGGVLLGEGVSDLAFDEAQDEQGQADDGDQGGDPPVVLEVESSDGQGPSKAE